MTAPGVRVSIGVSGSGKSYGIKHMVYSAVRSGVPTVAVDYMGEWSQLPRDVARMAAGYVYSKPPTSRAVREMIERLMVRGRRLVILRPEDDAPIEPIAYGAAAWARANKDQHRGIAITEAHEVLPTERVKLDPIMRACIVQWRHHKVSCWLDSQRFALLNRTAREQATELRLYAMVGDDLDLVREIGGEPLEAAISEAARRMDDRAHGGDDQPGWHVLLRRSRRPPYELTRDSYDRR